MRRVGPRCLRVPFPGCSGCPLSLQGGDQGTGPAGGAGQLRGAGPGPFQVGSALPHSDPASAATLLGSLEGRVGRWVHGLSETLFCT